MEQLMAYVQTTYRSRDWHDLFQSEVGMWTDLTLVRVPEERPWSDNIWATYLRWLRVHGGAHIVPIPEETVTDSVGDMAYLRETPAHLELVKHTLRDVLRGCAWAVKKGFRRVGKKLLKSCSTTLDIVGEPHRLPRVLESKGLPTEIDSIPDSSDEDYAPEPGWEEQRFMQGDFSLHDFDKFFDVPRPSQPIIESRRSHSAATGAPPHSEAGGHNLRRSHSQPSRAEPPPPPPPPPAPHSQPHTTEYPTYQSPYPQYQTQTQYGGGYSQTQTQYMVSQPRPHMESQPLTPSIQSQADAYFQTYGVPLDDPLTPFSQSQPGHSYSPAFGQFGASSSRPPRYPTAVPTPVPFPPPPPPGLAPNRDRRDPPGAYFDWSPDAGRFRRDGRF